LPALTQQELESRLWDAANSLRGPVDPADFKAYIFPLLFFKWISDTWDWERAQAVADFGDDLTEEIEADYHRFVVPADAHWSELRKLSENVGVELQKMLDKLQAANPDKLAGIFGDVAWGNKERLPEEALLNLIDSFDRLKLDDPWVVADGTQSGANHMSTGIVPFTIRADVRHPVTTTGGVQLRWNRRYLNYGPANGKVDGHTTVGAWQGQEFIQPVCDPSGTSWLSCGRGFSRQFNSTTDAWMIRVLALSTSGGYVYIDRFGYFGGTS
jgi:hypothetical protein